MSTVDDLRRWMTQNKLKAVFSVWGAGMAGSLAYQWSRPIPASLKLIHARVYAQALTLAAMLAAGSVHFVESGREAEERQRMGYSPKVTGTH